MKLLYKNNIEKPKRALIHTYSVGYLYTQIAIIRNLLGDDCQIDILLSSFSDLTMQSVLELAKDVDYIGKMWVISDKHINKLEALQYKSRNFFEKRFGLTFLNRIKKIFHKDLMSKHYDIIIYTHDVLNSLIGMLSACYPQAQLITVGDGCGFFNDKEIWKNHYNFKINESNVFEFIIPDMAINILPVQIYKKDFFEKTQLKILSKKDLLESFKISTNIYNKINEYLNELLLPYLDKTKCFFISENYAQAEMISYQDEIILCSEFIKKYCPENSVVFVKPHPLEAVSRIEDYKTILGDKWDIVELDKNFVTYPVEMLSNLIEACNIIISSGTARLTLKYLYNKDVICPFCEDRELFNKYFKEDKSDIMNFTIDYVDKPLKALGNWDMKSILCSNIRED